MKSNYLSTNLIIGLILIVSIPLSAGTYSGGTGTSGDPYQINNTDDLIELSNTFADWGAYFKQTADISFNTDPDQMDWNGDANAGPSEGFSPIGNGSIKFTGSYDGNNYEINNLFINRPDSSETGFFGYISDAVISNLFLSNSDVSGGDNYVGILAGRADNSTTVTNSSTSGTVSGNSNLGGVIGHVQSYSVLSEISSSADVSSSDQYVGGLIGQMTGSSSLLRSYSNGSVEGRNKVGGAIGAMGWNSLCENSFSKANVVLTSTLSEIGGLVGEVWRAKIRYCYSTGHVDHGDKCGGLVGSKDPGGNFEDTGNFWNTETSGLDSSEMGTGKTTAEMTDDTPTDNIYLAAGWDFDGESANGTDDIWNIGSGYNDGYPFLSWEHPEADTPLPITLVYFDACLTNGAVKINWQTASESENLAFRIYRDEEMIVELDGAGTTSEPQNYTYTDQYVIPGRTYTYVLADVDLQGKETKHSEIEVEVEVEDGADIDYSIGSAYPNPFNPVTMVPLNLATNADVRAFLYDLSGRMIRKLYNAPLSAGSHELTINGSNLSTGIYLLQIRINDALHVQKIALMK